MRQTALCRCGTAIALLLCCCLFTVACVDNPPRANHGGPLPDDFFSWSYNASVGATTPQEAYARSARFTPCRMPQGITTSPDQSVTWLVSGPRVGVAYLRATCRGALRGDYLYRGILEVGKGPGHSQNTSGWSRDLAELRWPLPPTASPPTPTSAPVAPSIADLLPADSYRDSGPGRMSPPAAPSAFIPVFWACRTWIALTPRDYVLGLVADSDVRPPDAPPTTVGGLTGWVTEANGMATVVTPRSASLDYS